MGREVSYEEEGWSKFAYDVDDMKRLKGY